MYTISESMFILCYTKKFFMQKLPNWGWALIGGTLIGGLSSGYLVIRFYPQSQNLPISTPTTSTPTTSTPTTSTPTTSTPTTSTSPADLVNITVLVVDKKSKIGLENVDVTVAAKEGIPTKPTLTDGTVTFQIPKQQLGQVNVTAVKSGYIRKELPLVFAINPNEIPRIELEEDTSSPNPGGSSSSPKIDWGILKSYFDIDDDLNIRPNGDANITITVHVTAKKNFNAISFKAQPYDVYGVRTPIERVSFSYSPPKWNKGDRSLVSIGTPIISKLEILY
ncbi:MAG: hypothetical protein V7L22_18195 [Nostoc sp.]|uniref:hypothetical protein n=1 Tax=Nostoc sp. TaxID=1180 RepID=UPI002FFB2665